MDAVWVTLAIAGALAVGIVLGWQAQSRFGHDDTAMLTRLAASEAAATALREQLDHERAQRQAVFDQARQEQAAQRERERRDSAVLAALAPVQETLSHMQRSVGTLERDRQAQFGALTEQLRRAQQSDEQLQALTASLAGALRSTSVRGSWGETQLRRLVEAAGMLHHVDFDLQVKLDVDGNAARPDMVVRLPGGKTLVVDAKAPLDAFLRAEAAAADAQTATHAAHAKAVRAHVDALAKRAYWAGLPQNPEFVVCFLPSEAMLAVALEADPALLEHAFSQRVALASPVSLWTVLRTVAFTWTQEDVSAQAQELFRLGNQLYERLATLSKHASDLRTGLERAVGAYNRFAGSLESRVLVTARRFPGIDATKLDAIVEPQPITTAPTGLTAAELIAAGGAEDDADAVAEPARDRSATPADRELARDDLADLRIRMIE